MQGRRVALITGASRGIGSNVAHALAAEGYDLTLTARSEGMLKDLASDLGRTKASMLVVPADMSSDEDIARLSRAHASRFDRLDLVVLAAGVGASGPLDTYPLRRLDLQLAVNLRGPMALVQLLLPMLRATASTAERGSRIVAIASLVGVVAEPELAAYGASKAALISLCEAIASAEGAAESGVTATAICPGYVDTDMAAWVHDRVDPGQMIHPSDVSEMVLALTRMSRNAALPRVTITRPGGQLWRA